MIFPYQVHQKPYPSLPRHEKEPRRQLDSDLTHQHLIHHHPLSFHGGFLVLWLSQLLLALISWLHHLTSQGLSSASLPAPSRLLYFAIPSILDQHRLGPSVYTLVTLCMMQLCHLGAPHGPRMIRHIELSPRWMRLGFLLMTVVRLMAGSCMCKVKLLLLVRIQMERPSEVLGPVADGNLEAMSDNVYMYDVCIWSLRLSCIFHIYVVFRVYRHLVCWQS